MDDAAGHVVHSCLTELQTLVESLLQGHVPLGHLQTCLRYKEQFKRLHQQCMNLNKHHHNITNIRNFYFKFPLNGKDSNNSCIMSSTDKKNTKSKAVPVEALTILVQREKDLSSFMLRKEQMDTLIKMIGKVTESITGK